MITLITPDYAYDYGLTTRFYSLITLITAKLMRIRARNNTRQYINNTHARAHI